MEVIPSSEEIDVEVRGDAGDRWIGVSVKPLREEERVRLDVDADENGVLVLDVAPDSPAAGAGLERLDLLVEAEGRPLRSPRDLIEIIRNAAQSEVRLEVIRNGERVDVVVNPSDRPRLLDRDPNFFFRNEGQLSPEEQHEMDRLFLELGLRDDPEKFRALQRIMNLMRERRGEDRETRRRYRVLGPSEFGENHEDAEWEHATEDWEELHEGHREDHEHEGDHDERMFWLDLEEGYGPFSLKIDVDAEGDDPRTHWRVQSGDEVWEGEGQAPAEFLERLQEAPAAVRERLGPMLERMRERRAERRDLEGRPELLGPLDLVEDLEVRLPELMQDYIPREEDVVHMEEELSSRIDELEERLDRGLESVFDRLNGRLERLFDRLEGRVDMISENEEEELEFSEEIVPEEFEEASPNFDDELEVEVDLGEADEI